MDLHGNHPPGLSQEIQCADCGHLHVISPRQKSSQCSQCGNIAFHASSPSAEISREIVQKNVLPLLAPRKNQEQGGELSYLDAFQKSPDGLKVQEVLIQYQVEWQLWAMVVKNFSDPVYHAAYLSHVIGDRAFEQASSRYREHRSVMALSWENKWQAEIADLMLERLEAVAFVRLELEGRSGFSRFKDRLLLLPLNSRAIRLAWVIAGIALTAKIFW